MPGVVCRVGNGAMAHERALFIEGIDGEHESWADPKDVTLLDPDGIDDDRAQGVVTVRVVERDEASGRALVQLPSEVVHGSRRVWIALSQLRA